MAYVNGFISAVPAANKQRYLTHAGDAAVLFREFGATRLVEAWGDDVPDGKLTDFKRAVQARDDEVVVFGWMEFASREARDHAHHKMFTDPRMEALGEMPFDGKRMVFGGFEPILDTGGSERGAYADGFLVAVPQDNKQAYLDMATKFADVFLEYGAVRAVEAWEDDVPDGELTDMRRAVQATADEKIVFSWVEWPSKAARDAGMKKMMEDPRVKDHEAMPFDGKRMIFGGFDIILDGLGA